MKIDNKVINKVIGIINLVLGTLYIASPLTYLLINQIFIFPAANQMYSDFNITAKPSYTFTYIVLGIVMLMGVITLFFGFKILKNKDNKYLKYGTLLAIVTFILYSVLSVVAALPVILSIYNITSQF